MKKLYFLLFLISGLANAQTINFPDANFKAALLSANASNMVAHNGTTWATIDTSGDGEIQVSEAQAITILQLQSGGVTDLSGIENFTNLINFGSYNNSITNISIIDGFANLQIINISGNLSPTTSLSFTNLPALTIFSYTYSSSMSSLSISNAPSLQQVNIWNNTQLNTLNLIALPALFKITANECALSSVSITNSPLMREINFSNNDLTSIQITDFPLLRILLLSGNEITSTSAFTNINNIEEISLQANQITNLVLPTSLPLLRYLYVGSNDFSTVNVTGYPSLRGLAVNSNNISSIDVTANPLLQQLVVGDNPISTLDLSGNPILTNFDGFNMLVTELDFSNNPLVSNLTYFGNPNLTHINLKSGAVNAINYGSSNYGGLPNLAYICIDEGDTFTYSLVTPTPTVPITSYCDFVPGGDYNTIQGLLTFDADNNGCDANDTVHPYMKVKIIGGAGEGSTFTNPAGNYTFYTQAGTFAWLPDFEHPTWFNISPTAGATVFNDNNNNVVTQDFCITANGNHTDVEMVIEPVTPARPGFDAIYRLVYKNNGNQTETVFVNFGFDDTRLQVVSTSAVPYLNLPGDLAWQINNLMPFQSGSILVTLHVNSPVDTPAVNIGDVLQFTSFVDVSTDENWDDNSFPFNQTVVGAYDPNDVTCIEGTLVSPSEIGDYLHYVIRFENTGNFEAENVVVRVEIDPAQFDISSIQLLNTSHPVETRVIGSTVEFIFPNILLESGGHGNVLLKIQTQTSLQQGDVVNKQANIYFDYNLPVETNNAETVFQALSNPDFESDTTVSIYPNPTSAIVNIRGNFNIKSTQLFDVQGRLLQTNLVNDTTSTLDVSSHSNGVYFVKVITDKGIKVEKLVKQ